MKKILFAFLCLLPLFASAESINIDSLLNVLNTKKPSVDEQLSLYKDICFFYYFNAFDSDKTLEYAKKGLALSNKTKNDIKSSEFNGYMGYVYLAKMNLDSAQIYLENALKLAIRADNDEQLACAYNDMGSLYGNREMWDEALEYFLKALPYTERLEDKRKYMTTLGNLGSIHRMLENQDKAILLFEQMREISEETNSISHKLKAYYELGTLYKNKPDYEKSFQYLETALEISRELGNKQYETICLQVLAQIYSRSDFKEYDKAIKYTKESIALSEGIVNKGFLFDSWLTLSTIYSRQEKHRESIEATYKAMECDTTSMRNMLGIYNNLTESYIGLGKADSATLFFHKYHDLKDRYISAEYQESIAKLETEYETEKKEMKIAGLEEERKWYVGSGIIIAIALLLGIGLLMYRHRLATQKRKIAEQQIKQLEQEKELIAARSALDAEKAEREIIARDLHDGVGAMLSVVKNNMNIMKSYSIIENEEVGYFNKALDVLDKSIVELRRVAHHIMPATLIDKGLSTALEDFCRSIPEVEFHFTGSYCRFDREKELVLYRCAYELVNNALRHANASRIDVHLNTDNETVYLSVVDNGRGFDPQTALMGMGIHNMRTRLATFDGRLEIYSEEGKGTEVNVELDL